MPFHLSELCRIANRIVQTHLEQQKCSGMYSKKSWGGPVEPFIEVKFVDTDKNKELNDPTVSVIVWEWKDSSLFGKQLGDEVCRMSHVACRITSITSGTLTILQFVYICDRPSIKSNLCNATHEGEWILADDYQAQSKNLIRTEAIHLDKKTLINYPNKDNAEKVPLKTGYYCVATYPYTADVQYEAIVTFRNAYGELPAAQIPKLPFYGGITIAYFVVSTLWGFLYFQHRHDILAVQNYITAILVFLVVEMLMTWGFYDYQNRHGNNMGAKVLMIVVAVLNAFRNSFSFFLLLIVCMGYGVVKHTLGKTMIVVRWLAVAHFVFGVVYAVASLTIRPDDAGPLVLLVILPLSATLTAFYIWTLNSLNLTMKDLVERKQHVKADMYKKLWWCILTSIVVIFGFFFLNSFTFAGVSSPDFAPSHWQTRWFVLDGWLNLVYFVDVCFVAYMWRPTANNRRFAMSDEVSETSLKRVP